MSYVIAIAENLILIVALPWLVNDAARDMVRRLDNRGMFSIPFCRSLAIAGGGVLTIATGVLAGLHNEVSIAKLWDISGFWHTGRFLVIVEKFGGELWSWTLWSWTPQSITPRQLFFTQMLFVSAGFLALVNFAIAVMGWRSPAALRGLMAHIIISVSIWLILTIRVLAAIWVLHWLNFWALLILLIVLEMRRREESATRLSF